MTEYSPKAPRTGGWKRTLRVLVFIWLVLMAAVLIPAQIMGFFAYARSYDDNMAKAERSFEGHLKPIDTVMIAAVKTKWRMSISNTPEAKLETASRRVQDTFSRAGVDYRGPTMPPLTFDAAPIIKEWDRALETYHNADLGQNTAGFLDSTTTLIFKTLISQRSILSVAERMRRLELIRKVQTRVRPVFPFWQDDLYAVLGPILEDSLSDPVAFSKAADFIRDWDPCFSPYLTTEKWRQYRLRRINDHVFGMPYLDLDKPKNNWLTLAKIPIFRRAFHSRVAENVYEYNSKLKLLEGKDREQVVCLYKLAQLGSRGQVLDGPASNGNTWTYHLTSPSQSIYRLAAKRVLEQAAKIGQIYQSTGSFPDKLPLTGSSTLNPLDGKPIDYLKTANGVTIGISTMFVNPDPTDTMDYTRAKVNGLRYLPNPARFEVVLKSRK